MDPPAEPPASNRNTHKRRHDVGFITSAWTWFVRNTNRGVTLADDHIAWTFDNQEDSAWLDGIDEVRLQTAVGWRKPNRICEITFRDGYKLFVTDTNDYMVSTKVQRAAYDALVRDLHARLVAAAPTRDRPPIAFRAGWTAKQYRTGTLILLAKGAICILVPLIALLLTGEVIPFLLLVAGTAVIVPLWIVVQKNAPRPYDPAKLPKKNVMG